MSRADSSSASKSGPAVAPPMKMAMLPLAFTTSSTRDAAAAVMRDAGMAPAHAAPTPDTA